MAAAVFSSWFFYSTEPGDLLLRKKEAPASGKAALVLTADAWPGSSLMLDSDGRVRISFRGEFSSVYWTKHE